MPAIVTYALLSIPLIGAYAIFALGITVIYRASRVLNLSHGAMAMIPAYLVYSMVKAGVPVGIALVLGVVAGAGLGIAVERVFVRRLRPQGATAQTVGTVAVTGLLIAVAAKVWGSTPLLAPQIFPAGTIDVGSSGLLIGQLGLFGTAVAIAAGMFVFFARTDYGLALRGCAENRRAAALMGIDPDLAASAAWALGGGLAGLAGILLAAVTNLDPYTLSLQVLPAFVAALLGGLGSLTGALAGAAIAGLTFGVLPYFSGTPLIGTVVSFPGSSQLALALLALVAMAYRGRRIAGVEASEGGLTAGRSSFRPVGDRRTGKRLVLAGLAVAIWPWLVPDSVLGTSLLWLELALVAISLVLLTGWVGQISLAHASFVGVAALTTGLAARGLSLGFPLNTIVAAVAAGAAAIVLGVVALRVRGLYLAVATLIFAWMCDAFLFKTPWLGASGGSSTIPNERLGDPGGFPFIDLTSRRTLYYLFAAIVGVVIALLANVRDTRIGRAFFAVRGSEMAAASLGIDVVRTKLIAFALSGVVAGIAGNLLIVDQRTVVPGQFLFTISLQFLAVAVVGGLSSIGGAIAAAGVFAGLNELFFRVTALAGWLDIVSALLLTTVLLAYPGGLAAVPHAIASLAARARALWRAGAAPLWRRARETSFIRSLARAIDTGIARASHALRIGARAIRSLRVPGIKARDKHTPASVDWYIDLTKLEQQAADPVSSNGSKKLTFERTRAVAGTSADIERRLRLARLEVEGVTVRFGGLTAVKDASLRVPEGEITGLIGPNGAGKTTLFNAILGLNDPVAGRVDLYGVDASGLAPHLRARLGVARTFQVLQLFNELTVFENLLVATHQMNDSGLLSNMIAGSRTMRAEAGARVRVHDILRLLELEDIADRPVKGLPFGTLRMVELGRALVTGARLVMLDEPASGLNDAETDRLASVIAGIRGLGVSVLLIEHDVRMVAAVCDYIYVLEFGEIIAEGTSDEIQRDPKVVAAYLGEPVTDLVEA